MKRINNKGFTMIETVVATAIFVVIMMITGAAFKAVLSNVGQLNKNEESNIEGVVGLEMFRHDIEQAGFGLPDSLNPSVAISYTEAGYLPASAYNDIPPPNPSVQPLPIPRAIVGDHNLTTSASDPNSYSGVTYSVLSGTNYLALKATSLGTTPAAQNWTYMNGSSTINLLQGSLNTNDQVIVINRTFPTSPGPSNQLVYSNSNNYWANYNSAGLGATFSPTLAGQLFYIYGVQSYTAGGTNTLGMPFNRADYFVATPSSNFPSSCAPGTGILYKAIINHSDGKLTYLPIMDCVADMQVVLGWNLSDSSGNLVASDYAMGSGLMDTFSNADGTAAFATGSFTLPQNYVQNPILADAAHIRTKLKLVKVYILAQVGQKDPNYTNSPASIQMFDPNYPSEATIVRPATSGNYNLSSNMLNYHWKVYRLVVKPNNLISNQ